MSKQVRRLFLVDSLGAANSTLMLGVVLPYFSVYIGMPGHVLYSLAACALFFTFFSGTCFFINPPGWRLALQIIAALNISYCLASISLVYAFWNSLTQLGAIYFIVEKIVVLTLAAVELYVSRHKVRTAS